MKTLHIQTAKNPSVLANRLFKLERCGKYEEALSEISDIWADHDAWPIIDSFGNHEGAKILLRCGSLIGFDGHNRQLPRAQERSRDVLMEARSRFIELDNGEKTAECENYLALSYWRTGEQNEAQAWIDESFSREIASSNPIRLFTQIIQTLVNINYKRFEKSLSDLRPLETAFLDTQDACLIGDYYNHCGLAYKNLDAPAEALKNFELAKHYHKQSRHKIYLGTVENNLAQLYKQTRKFSRAHESIDNATALFKQIGDRTREGFSLDTKALIYFAEAKFTEALQTVNKAIAILRKSENISYLVETLLTKAKILLFLNNFSDAVLNLSEAVTITRVQTGDKSAMGLIQEFECALDAKNAPPKKNLGTGNFELILPKSLAHFTDYRGIWINGTRLESIGLGRGSLAVVVKANVKRGDLVAVTEVETQEVSCGFYDADFGIVCLESTTGDPQIFDEKEIRILGKIVGVCNSDRTEDGKMIVESLNL